MPLLTQYQSFFISPFSEPSVTNEQLSLMAINLPRTKEELLKIKNVNEQKYKQFGERFLSAINSSLPSESNSTALTEVQN